jgi:5-formyltetrahydrofolate cyclo-ligase
MTLAETKRALRREAKARRRVANERLADEAGEMVRAHFATRIKPPPDAVVGA